ncbi:MAG: AraC family transcriptional regulator ligand-binding domain-containing protein [Pseudomonadota bacterium]
MNPTDLPLPIHTLLPFCIQNMAEQGYDLGDVLAGTPLDGTSCERPESLLSGAQELAIYANIQRLLHPGAAGLEVGSRINVNAIGMMGGLLRNSRNVGHAGYLLRRFHPLTNRWFTSELIGAVSPGKTVVRYRPVAELGELYRLLIDISVRGTQQLLIEIFGEAAGAYVSEVTFGYPAPKDAQRYETELGCPVHFGNEFTLVSFDNEIGKMLNAGHSNFNYHVFHQQCRDAAFRFGPTSWRERTLNILASLDHYPSAEAMAEKLNCSERSLRRHFSNEGVQYSELIDKVRFDRAAYLLAHSTDSVKKISYQLAYSEPQAFGRAFFRWSGLTPTQFRRSLQ